MAERRMFSKNIINSDRFLDMPATAQNLYFHLGMRADDEGILDNPNTIKRAIGASEEDLQVLIDKGYVLKIDNLIIIAHWNINNSIRKDRAKETLHKEGKKALDLDENGVYLLRQPSDNQVTTKRQPSDNQTTTKEELNGDQMSAQVRLDKVRLDKVRLERADITPEELENLYIKTCPNLKVFKPVNYSKEFEELKKSGFTIDKIKKAFEEANSSEFLQGKKGKWRADFRWIIKPNNLEKILAGDYKDDFQKKEKIQKQKYDFEAIKKRPKFIGG